MFVFGALTTQPFLFQLLTFCLIFFTDQVISSFQTFSQDLASGMLAIMTCHLVSSPIPPWSSRLVQRSCGGYQFPRRYESFVAMVFPRHFQTLSEAMFQKLNYQFPTFYSVSKCCRNISSIDMISINYFIMYLKYFPVLVAPVLSICFQYQLIIAYVFIISLEVVDYCLSGKG